jgi:integrase
MRSRKAKKPARPWVEPEQLPSLLDAATGTGRMLLALLAGTGLRISEALALRWQHIDLGTGTLYVVESKTERGVREVHLSHALREELALYRADARYGTADDFVLCTSTGGRHSASNLRRDVLAKTVDAANVKLEAARIAPIPPITFHSLRRTYASLRIACGDDVSYVAAQLGHEDGRFTLRVYTQATKRRERLAKPQLREYDRAIEWAQLTQKGTDQVLTLPVEVEAAA